MLTGCRVTCDIDICTILYGMLTQCCQHFRLAKKTVEVFGSIGALRGEDTILVVFNSLTHKHNQFHHDKVLVCKQLHKRKPCPCLQGCVE